MDVAIALVIVSALCVILWGILFIFYSKRDG